MAKELLSDATIRTTKPTSKDVRLFDGNGLYLLIKPNDSRWWRIDYTINNKRKMIPTTNIGHIKKRVFSTIERYLHEHEIDWQQSQLYPA